MSRIPALGLVSVSALALLSACGPRDEKPAEPSPSVLMDATSPGGRGDTAVSERALAMAPPAVAKPSPRVGGVPADANLARPVAGAQAMPVVAPSLAYEYSYALELPAGQARGQLTAHQRGCEEAGPAVCQVIAAESVAVGSKEARGSLEIRASADWLRQFRARLESDTGAAGGKVVSVTTRTEDLTRSMVDTEAAIRSQLILQARMERILAERTGDLDQAIAIEQEVARVRAGVDAMRSSLEVMRARTAMQKLTISYSVAGAAPAPTLKPDLPPVRALKAVGGNILELMALLIILGSYLAPLGLLVWGGWWLSRRLRKSPRPAPTPAPAEPPN